MEIRLNGKMEKVAPGSIRTLVEDSGLNEKSVVVELNGEILDKALYSKTNIKEKDCIEIVHFEFEFKHPICIEQCQLEFIGTP